MKTATTDGTIEAIEELERLVFAAEAAYYRRRRSGRMKSSEVLEEYRVSPRVVLRPGDRFRISGGPYYRLSNGTKVPIAVRGICTFIRATRSGPRVYIEARNKEGTVLLHVAGRRRNEVMPDLVCRPYTIKSRLRKERRK